jgi:natural product biosynthesis luciferase-like monooxygenase protein
MPGSFRSTLPLRVPVDAGADAAGWMRGVQRAREALRPFEHVSHSQVRAWAGLPAGAPLFESALETAAPESDALVRLLGGLAFQDVAREDPSEGHALEVRVTAGQEVAVRARFDPARVDAAAVDALLEGFLGALDAFGAGPERRVAELLAAAGDPGPARVEVGASHAEAAAVEAVLARHPAVESVGVESTGGGLRARIVPRADAVARDRARKRLSFSLFYFADAGDGEGEDKYRIYLEGGQFADRSGFEAVWAPERHFHENGGLYPNPSVLSAALAPLTRRVGLRAGSVALPLHHPLRVAEEWSVVDNLSRGRAGISVTSGWIPNDFALAPHNFSNKREVMFRMIEEVRTLWRGGTLPATDGAGKEVELRIFPRPIQPDLPVWITCSGDPAVFARAGELGHHCLTALLTQPLEEASDKIRVFREARERAGLDPAAARVTLMLHTFVADGLDEALARVKEPLTTYLRSHIGLMETMVKSLDLKIDINEPHWLDYLASFAFERYYRHGAFIGTPESCLAMVDRVVEADVDEVACLIDFGVDTDSTLAALPRLNALRAMCAEGAELGPTALRRHLARRIPDLRAPVAFEVAGAGSEATAPAEAGAEAVAV